ncbi:type I methionyl aminopeptidase [Arachnia propionica]|uniref:Methionine aminopeptidase n=1 Tax=Arachnia propionica TaxID=1750 RepID=A0A3P1T9W6_9ACTN|nr:type I methionyl aminopeptidase [Arachnia propionica]MDO5084493.1 type I methionyl aminopeptidase [Arachnia propionica]RRD06088.1 type I methionyl aminopeptidase [Arachnia propionica]
MTIEVKTAAQLLKMRQAGLVVAEGLRQMRQAAVPGVTTADIDAVGRRVLAEAGAQSNFDGYGAEYGTPFKGVACISVNDELVHGMPGRRVIREGDLVSVDFGAVVDGWHGDAARTFIVGEGRPEDEQLNQATREALWAGIAAVRDGCRVVDISRAIERSVTSQPRRYGSLKEYTGHGIGSQMHMDPDVPNQARRSPSTRLRVGMAIAIEPMLTLGLHQTVLGDDEWTVLSRDGSRGSHWENTVAITEHGVWVLTEPDGGRAELEARGVPFGPLGE